MGAPLIVVYFHRIYVVSGLYKLRKSEYSTTAVEGCEEPDERNRNRTRGTSRDGIQRYKISAVE
jgi:hypothetical protein